LGAEKFQSVIVSSGEEFADALAGSYLAAVMNAPILLVKDRNKEIAQVKEYIQANLNPGGTVYLLGGEKAVSKKMEYGLGDYTIKRLGGNTRYDTNLLILQEAGVGDKDIIVCTGLNFADSLSASATGLPILLVKDGLYANQKEFLKNNGGNFIVVGGINAVNATVEKQLGSYGSVKRLAGNTRYDTSVLVAKEFFNAPKSAVLAYAQNFPDGLSGGPLAYALKAPLILTDNNKPAAAVTYATGAGIKSGYALGGTGLISDKVVKNIFSMASGEEITVK
jgi:putative cell wall-binding protein